MELHLRCVFLLLIVIRLHTVWSGTFVNKFVYQMDLSEHCRRRVMPSVFLGRHVVEANSQILHFSQLDVPYGCYISIRTESGSNIILVIQVTTSKRKQLNCESKDENQVLVYELGETFGGYWGPIPDSVLRHTEAPSSPAIYTIPTQPPTLPIHIDDDDVIEESEYEEETTTTTQRPVDYPERQKEYIEVEVPLLNVSGFYVPSNDTSQDRAFPVDDNFDLLYDVAPKPGVPYDTSVMPVVQFMPMALAPPAGRRDDSNGNQTEDGPRYELDYDVIGGYTPDPRLTYSYERTPKRRNYLTKKYYTKTATTEENFEIYFNDTAATELDLTDFALTTDSDWNEVEQLMKSLSNESTPAQVDIDRENKTVEQLVQQIANIEHNKSVYLQSNWSVFRDMSTADFKDTSTATSRPVSNLLDDFLGESPPVSKNHETSETTNIDKTIGATSTDSIDVPISSKTINIETKANTDSQTDVDTKIDEAVTVDYTKINTNDLVKDHRDTIKFWSPTATTKTTSQSYNTLHISAETVHSTKPINNDLVTKDDGHDALKIWSPKQMKSTAAIETPTVKLSTGSSKETIATQTKTTSSTKPIPSSKSTYQGTSEEEDKDHNIQQAFDADWSSPNVDLSSKLTKVTSNQKTTIIRVNNTTKPRNKEPSTVPMKNYKSFENVVNAAPVMADVLTSDDEATTRNIYEHVPFKKTKRRGSKRGRKKRYVSVIPIYNARPHNQTNSPVKAKAPESLYHFNDRQDFEQLVELQDDGLYGHMALRYMRRYVGNVLFNLCHERSEFNVFLFNASRIVLAISNFTLKRMTVIATPARTMASNGGHCPNLYLECQIKGARVCVDTVTACDGVPNCGAWDIYDEDRLYCGADNEQRQSVYLSALTFLAVMLTSSYTVYYWLRRCVPKVSDAFFIYTDGTENVLYLETVMRSHNEADEMSKMVPSFFYDNELDMMQMREKSTPKKVWHRIRRFFRNCCGMGHKYGDSMAIVGPTESFITRQMKMFPYTEVELKKMTPSVPVAETGVQTGDSLEKVEPLNVDDKPEGDKFAMLKRSRENSLPPYVGSDEMPSMPSRCYQYPLCSEIKRQKVKLPPIIPETTDQEEKEEETQQSRATSEDSEMSVIKFFKAIKTNDPRRASVLPMVDEMELRSTYFDRIRMSVLTNEHLIPEEVPTRPTLPTVQQSPRNTYGMELFYNPQRHRSSGSTQTDAVAGPSGAQKKLRFLESQREGHEKKPESELEPEDEHAKDHSKRFWGVGSKSKQPAAKEKKKTTLPWTPRT